MTITQERSSGTAFWSQVAVCKPGENYRIEATVSCDLAAGDAATEFEPCGFVLAVEPWIDDRPEGIRRTTPGVTRSTSPVAVRTYYEAPDGIRRIRVSVGIVNARGTARVHEVRLIKILELDEVSHVLAIPPPPHLVKPPRVAKSVVVCSETASQRPIAARLSAYFGASKVVTLTPKMLRSRKLTADAVLLPDARPPSSIRSLSSLKKLSEERIVIISLPAFAELAGEVPSLRRVEQDDDPIHAKVMYANHATRGFALHDVFPYTWSGKRLGSFVQHQYRQTKAFQQFCGKHGFEVLLASMCDQAVTSDRPISLFKETPGGGLFVLDVEPAEADTSSYGEPILALHLLLSILGQNQTHLGQYISPDDTEAEFRGQVRETTARLEHFVVHDAELPTAEITEQLVTIGREDRTYGLPLSPKPVILVRTGLTSGDLESVYGAYIWFKQLIRMEPYRCPYAQPLASQVRLAWVPSVAPWDSRGGWLRSDRSPTNPMTVEAEGSEIAALIDVVSRPIIHPRVVFPKETRSFRHASTWLPQLAAAFPPGPWFALQSGQDAALTDRDAMAWQPAAYGVHVAVDSAVFKGDAHRQVRATGGEVIRIEVPACEAAFTAYSIRSTDLVATLLEHVIGLQFGLIAVNRQPSAVRFNAVPPVSPGEALILDHRDPLLRKDASQAG